MEIHIFSAVVISLLCLSIGADAIRQTKYSCDKQDTFFKHRYIYKYRYTAKTSSSFDGATNSGSGYQYSCKMAIKVPKKCKFLMELSDCWLEERQEGPDEVYHRVNDASDFLKELQRYPVIFRMNKGMLVGGSLNADDRETLQALNIKRGILSSLQFQIMETEHYNKPIVQRDIFGDCPTSYSFSVNNGYSGHSYRNLRECEIRQIFKKQFRGLFSTIRPMTGGYVEGPISEGIYPFVSEVNCDYSMNSDQLLGGVYCLQQQYFKPAAYKGDILATAMTNISQNLVLLKVDKDRQKGLNLDPSGYSTADIRFDFGNVHDSSAQIAEITAVMDKLVKNHVDNSMDEVPGLFGEVVQLLRQASFSVLDDYRAKVFTCYGKCNDASQDYQQRYYLDALHSCGTEICLLAILEVMEKGQLKSSSEAEFYQGLSSLEQVPEAVTEKLRIYCETSGKTSCWLSLGIILSKLSEDTKPLTDSTASMVLEHIQQTLEENCDEDGPIDSVRELNTAIKTLENIGSLVSSEYGGISWSKIEGQMQKCLINGAVPKTVKRSILQVLEEQAATEDYKSMSKTKKETLFTLLEDLSCDMVLRTRAFSLLMKTTDKDIIKRLVAQLKLDQTLQMKSYMYTAVRTLLENDQPDIREVKAAWAQFRKDEYFSLYLGRRSTSYGYKWSKAISFADFYKLPLTEYFGEQLYVDVVFDPASSVLSALHLSLNFFYGNNKNPLFDMDLNIHGFDMLYQLLSEDSGLTFEQLYAMYKAAKSGVNENKAQFAAFQKDIIDAVMKILETVNHPKLTDFDLEIDLKLRGKNVMFVSLQEMIGYLRQIQQHIADQGSTASMDMLLKKLLAMMDIDSFKTVEFASLIKVLPTCVGLPMNMSVWVVGQNVIKNSFNLNFNNLNNFDGGASTHVTFKNEMKGQLTVPIGLNHQSGMKMKIYIGSERDADFSFDYSNDGDGAVRAEFKMFPIPERMESERLLHAKGRMFLLHQSSQEEVKSDTNVETDYTMCMNTKVQMILGRSLCANIKYPNVKTSRRHAYFPLSGPFDFEVTFAKVDGVVSYSWLFETFKNKPGYDKDTRFFNLVHNAPGHALGRHFFFNITVSAGHRILNVSSGLPALGFEYLGQFLHTRQGSVSTIELSEYGWLHKQPVFGYRLKGLTNRSMDSDQLIINTNFTLPGVSWDLQFESIKTNIPDGRKETVYHLVGKWFCSKDRPILYLLHLSPTDAAKNDDVTMIGFKYINTAAKEESEDKIHLELYDTVLKATLGKNFATGSKDIGLAYESGGVETVIIGAGTLNDFSSGGALFYDYNLNIDNDDYNMVMTGNMKGHKADVTLTADIEYTKKQDGNEVSRRRRSIKSIYNHFIQIEKAAAEKLKTITEEILGIDAEPKDVDITGNNAVSQKEDKGPGGQLPNMIPVFPSIWDMPKWNTQLNLNAKLQPKFSNDPKLSKAPVGMELVVTMDITHPWNGGYRVIDNVFVIGKSRKTVFNYFWFWIDNAINTSYTHFDGTAVLENGEPMVVKRGGNFNVFREFGERFEFSLHQFSPASTLTYEIVFDWDAFGHNDPLFSVVSSHTNALIPFLNHEYKEYFTYERPHIKHQASFEHSMLNVNILTDFYPDERMFVVQSMNISFMAFGTGDTVRLMTEAESHKYAKAPLITSKVSFDSKPDVTLVYRFGVKDPRILYVSRSLIPAPEAPMVDMWNIDLAMIETSIEQVTFTWTPAIHETMAARLSTVYINNGLWLKGLADILGENLNKPLPDQTLLFLGVTPRQLMKKYVFPRLVIISTDVSHAMANFVSLKERQAILDTPGPKVPPRFRKLLEIMSESNKEPINAIYLLQTLDYYALTGLSYTYLAIGSQMIQSQAMTEILQKREIVIGWTNPCIQKDYGDFPENTEAIKHVLHLLREIFDYHRHYYYYYYYDRSQIQTPKSEHLAVVFGRHHQSRPINLMTFDKKFYKIPAAYAESCVYLLAADLMNQKYALVMSPMGLTLLTDTVTVTISYEDSIYIDDSKLASEELEIDFLSVMVKRLDDRVTIETKFGVSVICYNMDADVCLVSIKGNTHNTTIGLLGTNDREKFTDWRLLNGHVAGDLSSFLSQYIVSGPEKCFTKIPDVPEKTICNRNFERSCTQQFYRSYNTIYKCGNAFELSMFKDVCTSESHRCDSVDEDKCYVYRAFTSLCEQSGLVSTPVPIPDVCDTSKPAGLIVSSKVSLDLVIAVSDHDSMLNVGKNPWEYMQELLTADRQAWDQFETVRIGIVGFAGQGDKAAVNVIWQGDSKQSYFADVDDIDWTLVSSMTGSGKGKVEDGFLAIQKAVSFPFNPTSNKMIILLMTKNQSSGSADKPQQLLHELNAKGIALNVFSTYAKVSSRKVIGINWEEKIITRKDGYGEYKALPNNDYVKLIVGTKGALWDLEVLKGGRKKKVSRVVDEFVTQTEAKH